MKKNLFSLLAMAALAVVFTACSQNEELSSSDQKSVFVKLDIGQVTRAIQAPFGPNAATVNSLRIYFHNGTSILKMVSVTSTTTPNITNLIAGTKISDVPSGATQVTVLGNLPASILSSVPTSGTIASVKSALINVTTQTTAADVLLTGVDGSLQPASGAGVPSWITGASTGDLYAEITIKPAFARVEIEGMKTKTSSAITAYKLKGIFLNNIYDEMQLGGTLPAGATLKNNGPDATKFLQDVVGGNPVYASTSPGILHDWYSTPTPGVSATGGGFQVTAGTNQRWAYQVIPNDATDKNKQLQIIIRLSDIIATGLTYTNDQFLSIRGFKDASNNDVKIEAGKIYTISTADFEFDENNITDTPVTEGVGVYLKVTVTPWSPVAVKPNL